MSEVKSGKLSYQGALSVADELAIVKMANKIQKEWEELVRDSAPNQLTSSTNIIINLINIENNVRTLKGFSKALKNREFNKCLREITGSCNSISSSNDENELN